MKRRKKEHGLLFISVQVSKKEGPLTEYCAGLESDRAAILNVSCRAQECVFGEDGAIVRGKAPPLRERVIIWAIIEVLWSPSNEYLVIDSISSSPISSSHIEITNHPEKYKLSLIKYSNSHPEGI